MSESITDPLGVEFQRVVAILCAADQLTLEEFRTAQLTARPSGYEDYIHGLWIPWRRGGLMWLAGRSDETERRAVFEAVLRRAEKGGSR